MDIKSNSIRLEYDVIKSQLENVLLKEGFPKEKAEVLSKIFTDNSLFGKDSHGVNRFILFIKFIRAGNVRINVEPVKISGNNAFEQWDGNFGPGPLNACFCTSRAAELASKYGIGCVAIRNTNHWMRGGTYGWQAADAGYIFISWTNAKPTMPPWGGEVPKFGNNPLVIAIPYKDRHIVLDMALSQYSYGRLEKLSQEGGQTDYYAGYDEQGNLTKDPDAVLNTERALPIGLWKGSGMALVFDIIAAALSDGKTTEEVAKEKNESGVSQIFIAIGQDRVNIDILIDNILSGLNPPDRKKDHRIYYPGELSGLMSEEYRRYGVPIDKNVWDRILKI